MIDGLKNLHRICAAYEPGAVATIAVEVTLTNGAAARFGVTDLSKGGLMAVVDSVCEELPGRSTVDQADVLRLCGDLGLGQAMDGLSFGEAEQLAVLLEARAQAVRTFLNTSRGTKEAA